MYPPLFETDYLLEQGGIQPIFWSDVVAYFYLPVCGVIGLSMKKTVTVRDFVCSLYVSKQIKKQSIMHLVSLSGL